MATSGDLIASVKRRSGMPAAQATYTNTEILSICNEELVSYVVPFVLRQREDYWLKNYDATLVSGTTSYKIPYYAIGNKVRDVQLLDASGYITNLPRFDPADLQDAGFGFWIEGDRLLLVNKGTAWQYGSWVTLRIPYMLRPRLMVDSATGTNYATVASFSAANKTVTVSENQTTWATAATPYDIIRSTSPYEVIAVASSATRSNSTFTFTDAIPSDIAAGDMVCKADASIYPQLPVELHPMLAQKAANRILADKQLWDKLKAGEMELTRYERDLVALIAPRVDGEAPRLVVRNGLHRIMN